MGGGILANTQTLEPPVKHKKQRFPQFIGRGIVLGVLCPFGASLHKALLHKHLWQDWSSVYLLCLRFVSIRRAARPRRRTDGRKLPISWRL